MMITSYDTGQYSTDKNVFSLMGSEIRLSICRARSVIEHFSDHLIKPVSQTEMK